MKKGLKELVFILDKSGSMHGVEEDTMGGFNSTIAKSKAENQNAYVTMVLFNSSVEIVHDKSDIKNTSELTKKDSVSGGTALLDTVGDTAKHIDLIHKYARAEDLPERIIIMIMNDGMENLINRYDYREIHELIENHKKIGWEFVFFGANINAGDIGEKIGVGRDRSLNYQSGKDSISDNFETINLITRCESREEGDVALNDLVEDWDERGGNFESISVKKTSERNLKNKEKKNI